MEGDFIAGLPAWLGDLALGVTGLLLISHIWFRLRSRLWSPGRDLWMTMTGVVWFGGIVFTRGDLQFTLTNVLAHGIPYMVLVGWTCRRQWSLTRNGALKAACFQGFGLCIPIAIIAALAFLEEGLWDVGVWQENTWLFGSFDSPPDWINLLAVGVLAIPQTTHYVLDAIIWKVRDNPGLDQWLDLPLRKSS